MKFNKFLLFFLLILLFLFSKTKVELVSAEQIGDSPESGVDSKLKEVYNLLADTYSQGSDESGDWGDWGAYWNRVRYNIYDYSQQSLVEYDDYKDGDGETEESIWTQTNTSPEVWKDELTGLYWSASQGSYTNAYSSHSACGFYDLSDRGSYDGSDVDCGNAINYCGTLSLDDGGGAETDWYIPSQKELIQAYIDGIENGSGVSFAGYTFISSTEEATGYYFYLVNLRYGSSVQANKTNPGSVRCVRRD